MTKIVLNIESCMDCVHCLQSYVLTDGKSTRIWTCYADKEVKRISDSPTINTPVPDWCPILLSKLLGKEGEAKKFTVEDFKTYIRSQDSIGDIMYNLNEENIIKAINASQPENPLL